MKNHYFLAAPGSNMQFYKRFQANY